MATKSTAAKPIAAKKPAAKRKTAAQRAAEAEIIRKWQEAEARKAKRRERRRYVLRFMALFIASGLSVITTGAILDVDPWKSIIMGGVAGFVQFTEKLARSAIRDGDVSKDDVDAALDALSE